MMRPESNEKRCAWCGGCVAVCPEGAITLYERIIEIDDSCNGCGICLKFCPVGALSEVGSAV
jgi:ferredoxin